MFIDNLCPPALIYLIFSLVQIVIDTLKGLYNTAFIKVWITILFTSLLNILCERGLSLISWLIVFLPFIFMATLTTILLVSFGMDPYSGKFLEIMIYFGVYLSFFMNLFLSLLNFKINVSCD